MIWRRKRENTLILRNVSFDEFKKEIDNKKIIQFGASSAWDYYLTCFSDIQQSVLDNTIVIIDNSEKKQGTTFEVEGRYIDVEAPETIKKYIEVNEVAILIVVSLAYQEEIINQLEKMNLSDDVKCYSLPLMIYSDSKVADNTCVDTYFATRTEPIIPTTIHSFWFSGEEKPDLYKRCIESWYKFCPGFEIKEWNANNYDINKNQYMKEAFENRKWAFVSDYARLDVINRYGGIYMDMDVELVASIDQLLCADSFFCRQEDGFLEFGSGFGASVGNEFIRAMLDTYSNRKLIGEDGSIDMTPQPQWLKSVAEKYGYTKCFDSMIVRDSVVLSNDYIVSGASEEDRMNAKLGIHWHNGGWLDEKNRQLIKKSLEVRKLLVEKYFVQK